ncbi:MAG: bifunctional [glutamate--ammonia ligase]-adenylyl-L-tyrosine phosphorylase/[glutamate--ammonia-ligase] adenylyltransferase [Betaproteobacteria bacterium]
MSENLIFESQLARTFRSSRYAERLCHAQPHLISWLRQHAASPFDRAAMHATLLTDSADDQQFHASLRHLRQRVMLQCIFRDINGQADLDETMATISALAEVTVGAAQQFHTRATISRFGVAAELAATEQAELVIVGMGKLGGMELNVSSDIDLIFVHAEDGEATRERSWHEFHAELGKRIIRALDHVDENGFVFRVDMRLRPFGNSGPLVSSLDTLENYFYTQARPWERYAWLKARALTGAHATTTALDTLVKPFVYRRYNDYAAIEEMRELHGQIRADASRRNRLEDIKVGVGGIREIEFIAQLFQLIRGGREPDLQTRSTRAALSQLASLGIVTPARVEQLQAAYAFLRNLEHRLQYLDDQQTQLLPANEEDRQRVSEAMNFANWQALLDKLNEHRQIVTTEFEALFASGSKKENAVDATGKTEGIGAICRRIAEVAGVDTAVAGEIEKRTNTWLNSPRTPTLSHKSCTRMKALIPQALHASLHYDKSSRTFFRLFDLIEAIDKRETYLALLTEYPHVLARVARLAAKSAWAADFLRKYPILLDELIAAHDAPAGNSGIDWASERTQLRSACDQAGADAELQYEILRRTKQVITLKLNIADIEGWLGVMALSDELSRLADMLLETALILAWRAMAVGRIEHSPLSWAPPTGFAVIGYGKLGSKELGYASDLDLVFLFDPSTTETEQFPKLAQRLNSWLNTTTVGGVLYETDLRLRPDGVSGLLVSPIEAFHDYQLHRAWTWEHQALTRARFCAGDVALAEPFEAIRREVLSAKRDNIKLRSEIVAMRDKMRAEKKDRTDKLDLKQTRGGIVDAEFIVQYIILAYSQEHPALLDNLGNFSLITRAAALGILDEDSAAKVAKAYLAYRERQHLARNNNELLTLISPDELSAERRAVSQAWLGLMG